MTDAIRRAKAHTPTDSQRASIATGMRIDPPRPPGAMDGQVRFLVTNGKPDCPEGVALLRWYNAHPPAEERAPVQTMATAMREKRNRSIGKENECNR